MQISIAGSDPRERARQEDSPPPTIEILAGPAGRSSITLPIVQNNSHQQPEQVP